MEVHREFPCRPSHLFFFPPLFPFSVLSVPLWFPPPLRSSLQPLGSGFRLNHRGTESTEKTRRGDEERKARKEEDEGTFT